MKNVFSFVQSKFGRRIFVLFFLCSLLPVCILALVSLQRVSSRLEQDSQERLRQAGKNAGMTILEGLTLLQAELESSSTATDTAAGDLPRHTGQPGAPQKFRSIRVSKYDAAGVDISGISRHLPPAAREHLSSGNALLLADAGPGVAGSMFMATTANRNVPQNRLLVGEINPEYLWTLVGYTVSRGISIGVLGSSGNLLYASRPFAPSLISSVTSQLKKSSTGQFESQQMDADFLVNYWSVFMKPTLLTDSWTVVAIQSKQDSVGPAQSFITTFILVIVLTLFVVVFASSVLIRRSLEPLSVLKDGAHRLSSGDFDSRVQITSGDEFEDLAATFNDMSDHLGNHFTRLRGMGTLVQKILEARGKETIIDEVIAHYCHSNVHEWIGISLAEVDTDFRFRTFYNKYRSGAIGKTKRFEVELSGDECTVLRGAEDGLHVRAAHGFTALLAPLAAEGAIEFYLQPIHAQNILMGVLILGYRQVPKQIQEELVRSRQIANEIAIALDNIRLIDELHWLNRGTIEVLANAVDAKSPWTAGHSQRVTRLALEIGKVMGLSLKDLELLHISGLFHDIGKIGIPEGILDKPGSLTDEEYALIKKHPEIGAEMLKPIRSYHEIVSIVGQHHEQFSGGGYPDGLAGEDIVLGARIIAVADVFDALYTSRPYRRGWDIAEVITYLEEHAGSNFDPGVVRAFLTVDLTPFLESPGEGIAV